MFKRFAAVFAAFFLAFQSVPVFAASAVEFTTLAEQQDLKVTFTFDTEIVPITFISPSGEEYSSDDSAVVYNEGDLWATYIIYDAEAGTWSVSYDIGNNSSINYSILRSDAVIWIQEFSCTSEYGIIYYEFYVESDVESLEYTYDLYAVNSETGAFFALIEDSGQAGVKVSESITPSLLSSGDYTFELDVYYTSEDGDVYDTASSDVISFTATEYTEETEGETEETADETEYASEESETEEAVSESADEETADESEEAEETEDSSSSEEKESSGIVSVLTKNSGIISIIVGAAVFIFCFIFLKDEI